jgi:hypothetical protein
MAKSQAAALGISLAEFIRRAIREQLPIPAGGPWMKYAGNVATGDPDSSHSVDEIVYLWQEGLIPVRRRARRMSISHALKCIS